MELDIRNTQEEEVTSIRIAEKVDHWNTATSLSQEPKKGMVFIEADHTYIALTLHNKQHALYLIKALEKAIELGWLK